jgi:long-chain acyl-CoA synthetase
VREYSATAVVELPADADLTDLVEDAAVRRPHHVQLRRRVDGRWEDVTARTFLAEVTALAKGLVAAGVEPGDRVGIMARTSYEWTLVDFALWFAGAVSVPVYETSSAEQVQWMLSDSGARACFVELESHQQVVAEVAGDLPDLRHVWCFAAGSLDDLVAGGRQVTDTEIADRRAGLGLDSLATIIYTSGTTGRPKGCQLTHGNFRSGIENASSALGGVFAPGSTTLLFLPLAHVFARVIQVGCLVNGVTLGHTADVKDLVADMASFHPTFVLSVPRVFEKIYNGAQAKAALDGKSAAFDRAAATAIRYSESLDRGGPSLALRVEHAVFDRLVYRRLREVMGGQMTRAVSGGAPLGARLGHFFRGVGVTILEGYGLTETTAASTVNRPDRVRVGSVGLPIPGSRVRIADDGEVLLRGPHVFAGYWHDEPATGEAIDPEGWFHSGDLGELDDDGFLTITGRKKEIIVTSSGKNVAPALLEDRLRSHALVSQCLVVGDNRPYVACLVTLDADALPSWLSARGRPADVPVADLVRDGEVVAEISAAVDDANRAVSKAEAIRRFEVLPVDFTEAGGHLTPTLKLRRAVIAKEFEADIADLYA